MEDTPAHVQTILNSWSARRLTLLGKITIIKSLAVSQIVYLLSSPPSHQKIVYELNSILYDFLWDSKGDKIKRTEIINDYDKGGLKMIDIQSFNASLKTKWVQSYLNTENKGKWKALFGYDLERYVGKLLFLCNLKQKDAIIAENKGPFFLKEIVEYWSDLNYSERNPDFESTCIWHNSLITIENKPFFYKSWFKAGVEYIKGLLDEASRFISFDVFVRKFKVKTNYLEYYYNKVVSTLTRYKKLCSPINGNDQTQDATKTLLSHTKSCKKAYQRLIKI